MPSFPELRELYVVGCSALGFPPMQSARSNGGIMTGAYDHVAA